jgi:hypothetical protein
MAHRSPVTHSGGRPRRIASSARSSRSASSNVGRSSLTVTYALVCEDGVERSVVSAVEANDREERFGTLSHAPSVVVGHSALVRATSRARGVRLSGGRLRPRLRPRKAGSTLGRVTRRSCLHRVLDRAGRFSLDRPCVQASLRVTDSYDSHACAQARGRLCPSLRRSPPGSPQKGGDRLIAPAISAHIDKEDRDPATLGCLAGGTEFWPPTSGPRRSRRRLPHVHERRSDALLRPSRLPRHG